MIHEPFTFLSCSSLLSRGFSIYFSFCTTMADVFHVFMDHVLCGRHESGSTVSYCKENLGFSKKSKRYTDLPSVLFPGSKEFFGNSWYDYSGPTKFQLQYFPSMAFSGVGVLFLSVVLVPHCGKRLPGARRPSMRRNERQ